MQAEFSGLHGALNDLKEAVTGSDRLPETEKLDLAVDIESIKDQLAKARPDKTIMGHLWSGLQQVATLSGIADAYKKVESLIGPLLS